MPKGDTERFLKATIDPLLSPQGKRVSRAILLIFRGGTFGLLGWIAVQMNRTEREAVTREDISLALSAHEARCEQVIIENREQIRELNRRLDTILRQRFNSPPRGGEGLMKEEP